MDNFIKAARHILHARLIKRAWSLADMRRGMVEGVLGSDLISNLANADYSEPAYISQYLFGDASAAPIIASLYKKDNDTGLAQILGVLHLLKTNPVLAQKFKQTYKKLTPEQREKHPFAVVLDNLANNPRLSSSKATLTASRNNFISGQKVDLDSLPTEIWNEFATNSYIKPLMSTYQDEITEALANQAARATLQTLNKQWGAPAVNRATVPVKAAPRLETPVAKPTVSPASIVPAAKPATVSSASAPTSSRSITPKNLLRAVTPAWLPTSVLTDDTINKGVNATEIKALQLGAAALKAHPYLKLYNKVQERYPVLPKSTGIIDRWSNNVAARNAKYPYQKRLNPGLYYSERGIAGDVGKYSAGLKGFPFNDYARHGFVSAIYDKKPEGVPVKKLSNGQYAVTFGAYPDRSKTGLPNRGTYLGINGVFPFGKSEEISSLNSIVSPVEHAKTDWSVTMHPIESDRTKVDDFVKQLQQLVTNNSGINIGDYSVYGGLGKNRSSCLTGAAFLLSNLKGLDRSKLPSNLGFLGRIPSSDIDRYKNVGVTFNPDRLVSNPTVMDVAPTQSSFGGSSRSLGKDLGSLAGIAPLDATAPALFSLRPTN